MKNPLTIQNRGVIMLKLSVLCGQLCFRMNVEARMQSVRVDRLRVVGCKQVLRALRANRLKRVYVARDAARELVSTVLTEAGRMGVAVEWVGTMRELAARFHVDVPSAAAGECGN